MVESREWMYVIHLNMLGDRVVEDVHGDAVEENDEHLIIKKEGETVGKFRAVNVVGWHRKEA